jgi:hypothetical protein
MPFLPELAELEWRALRALLAPSRASEPPGDGDWTEARVVLDPSVSLIETRWPVDRLWAARHLPVREGVRGLRTRRDRFLSIRRNEEGVLVEPLPAAAFSALASLRDGTPVAEAAAILGSPAQAAAWFSRWMRDGVIRSIGFPGVTPRLAAST